MRERERETCQWSSPPLQQLSHALWFTSNIVRSVLLCVCTYTIPLEVDHSIHKLQLPLCPQQSQSVVQKACTTPTLGLDTDVGVQV